MQPIDRRAFLRSSATAAGTLGLPSLLAPFFAAQDPQPARTPPPEPPRIVTLRAAHERARRDGKPLLVFVVPGNVVMSRVRGTQLGALLNHADGATLQELALCTLACASMRDVQQVLGKSAVTITNEPMMLLVDAAEPKSPDAVSVQRLECQLPRFAILSADADPAAEKAALRDAQRTVTETLTRSLHPDTDGLVALAARVRAALTKEQAAAIDGWLSGGEVPPDDLLVRAAAIVRAAAQNQAEDARSATLARLEAAVRKVVVGHRIAGSHWASSNGCSERIEDPLPGLSGVEHAWSGAACGIGHVPELATRYLTFLTGS